MRRDLKNTVRGGIDDQLAGLQMRPAIIQDDLRAGIGAVAEHTAPSGLCESVEHLCREAIRIRRQRMIGNQARDLPVPGCRILAL